MSANVGARVSLHCAHLRPFSQPWLARNHFELSRIEQKWEGELSTQTLPGLYRNLISGAADRVISATDTVLSMCLRVGRAQDTKTIGRLAFVEAERSLTSNDVRNESADALGAHYHGVWRDVDDRLLPTPGRVWTGQFGAGLATSNPGDRGPFARLYTRLDAFHPLGGRWLGQLRLEAAEVFSRDSVVVPESLRFRAGGDDSVRGYAYRSLTLQENDVDVSGKVLFTTSVEASHPLLDRIPALYGAVFIDAGRAAMRRSGLKPAVGIGAGLRYRSPVGPVKLDIAYGEELRKFRLHLTVGVTF